ncbi:MAG: flagellar basal body rod protein FlgC [Nitrospinota bacterium]|nr:MAG: flagellar basal body rod protein FlgC [Nitrospinota bacterium]
MNMMAGLEISFSALQAQRIRMNVIAANLANAETTRTPEGGPYKRREVIFAAQPEVSSFEALLRDRLQQGLSKVRVLDIITDPQGTRVVYDPDHPDADAQGYVTLPNINLIQEMVDLMSASRAYEANVTAINAFKDMVSRALQIGKA